jgi:hypothetical protein
MKKITSLVLAFTLMLAIVGCDDNEPIEIDPNRTEVDYDLTETGGRSALMNYGILVDMIWNSPQDFWGKTVRVQGNYVVQFENSLEREIDILFMPGPACQCPQMAGLKFADGVEPPDPNPDVTVEIVGTYGRFEEAGFWIRYFMVEEIVVLS